MYQTSESAAFQMIKLVTSCCSDKLVTSCCSDKLVTSCCSDKLVTSCCSDNLSSFNSKLLRYISEPPDTSPANTVVTSNVEPTEQNSTAVLATLAALAEATAPLEATNTSSEWLSEYTLFVPSFHGLYQASISCSINYNRCSTNYNRCSINYNRWSINYNRCSINYNRCSINYNRCSINYNRCSINYNRCSINYNR